MKILKQPLKAGANYVPLPVGKIYYWRCTNNGAVTGFAYGDIMTYLGGYNFQPYHPWPVDENNSIFVGNANNGDMLIIVYE